MAKFRDSKDANWVVGAVLLIAVMVAVSVVVDAWAGKTAETPQMEEFTVTSFSFSNGTRISVVVENNGTIPFGIDEVWINNEKQTFTANSTVIPPKDYLNLSISYMYQNDTNYLFKLISDRGNTFLFTGTEV